MSIEPAEIAEIRELSARFVELQKTLALTDNSFAARYKKFLGSAKTWARVKAGNWHGHIKQEKLAEGLRAMARHQDANANFDSDDYLAEMPFAKGMDAAFERLLGSAKDRRGLICLATEGCGKSWWSSKIVAEDVAKRFYISVSRTWFDKPLHLARAVCEKLGMETAHIRNPADMTAAMLRQLNVLQHAVLIFDEAQNGGVELMKMLKEIIEKTPTRVVYQAYPTQYDIVRSSSIMAVSEARQFIRRCLKPIYDDYRHGIGPKDVAVFLRQHGFAATKDLDSAAAEVAPTLAKNGNLATLADALEDAKAEADDQDIPLTLAMVTRAINSLCGISASANANGGKAGK